MEMNMTSSDEEQDMHITTENDKGWLNIQGNMVDEQFISDEDFLSASSKGGANELSISLEGESFSEVGNIGNGSFEKRVENFFDETTLQEIGKRLEEFTEDDMKKLCFKSLDVCEEFYKIYARVKGFGVRNQGARKSRKDEHPTSRAFVCHKQGFRGAQWLNKTNRKRRHRRITRCGCKAMIKFKFDEDTSWWFVSSFEEKHNHVLVEPPLVPYIRSHRQFTEADKIRIMSMYKSGIPRPAIMRNMVRESGSHDKVGFIMKDMYNLTDKIKKEEVKDGDAETVMAYLYGKKNSDPALFLRFTRDEEGRLDKLFWCDSTSRADYRAFHQVLAFDTTYKINSYNKPFVVLVGVNHHRSTVPFGCALIANETEETYIWVLEQMKEAGNGQDPCTIVTDGDKAMANAIEVVFPEARHRLCLWHILRNVVQNGGKQFANGFMACVDKCRTPLDFENAWDELMYFYKVHDKKWTNDLYKVRHKWAEAYLCGYFFAGIRSTQRCESMHSTVKKVIGRKIMFYQFVELYDQVLEQMRSNEANLEYVTRHTDPVIEGEVLHEVKRHASTTYTSNSYDIFCKELEFESMYIVMGEEQDDVGGPIFYALIEVGSKKEYIVIWYEAKEIMYCCCMKLECIGYPCRHMFAVMKYRNMREIPRGLIFLRWTKQAKEYKLNESIDKFKGGDEAAIMARYACLSGFSNKLNHAASRTYDSFLGMMDNFAKLLISGIGDGEGNVQHPTKKAALGIGDPEVVRGRGQLKRKRGRKCSQCHQLGHTIRTCSHPKGIEDVDDECFEDFDVNVTPSTTPRSSSPKEPSKTSPSSSHPLFSKLMDLLPNKYKSGDVTKAEVSYEVAMQDVDPTVTDWHPKHDW